MIHRPRHEVNQLIARHSFMPLFNPDDLEVTKRIVKSAYEGGVRVFECTNRSANALTIFKQLVPYVMETMPDLLLGAGTILNRQAATEFYEAGAQFIVAPNISLEVGAYCRENEIFWCPGASTLNEIWHATSLGADLVKIFPANYLGGPGFVKAILAPCPELRVMPTGGVDGSEQNLRAWFEAGVVCVGMGGQLFTREILAAKDYALVTTKARQITTWIQCIKTNLHPPNS